MVTDKLSRHLRNLGKVMDKLDKDVSEIYIVTDKLDGNVYKIYKELRTNWIETFKKCM